VSQPHTTLTMSTNRRCVTLLFLTLFVGLGISMSATAKGDYGIPENSPMVTHHKSTFQHYPIHGGVPDHCSAELTHTLIHIDNASAIDVPPASVKIREEPFNDVDVVDFGSPTPSTSATMKVTTTTTTTSTATIDTGEAPRRSWVKTVVGMLMGLGEPSTSLSPSACPDLGCPFHPLALLLAFGAFLCSTSPRSRLSRCVGRHTNERVRRVPAGGTTVFGSSGRVLFGSGVVSSRRSSYDQGLPLYTRLNLAMPSSAHTQTAAYAAVPEAMVPRSAAMSGVIVGATISELPPVYTRGDWRGAEAV
jgi:hypothetical protein